LISKLNLTSLHQKTNIKMKKKNKIPFLTQTSNRW